MRKAPERSLRDAQRWFQGAIVAPSQSTAPAKVLGARGRIRPSRTLSPDERVAIYARMFFARLLESLREDYPALVALYGDDAFEELARKYLERHPSRHFSLNELGRRLPEYLADPKLRLPRRALAADMARLEAAISRVFDASSSAPLDPKELAQLPASVWNDPRPALIEALELHAFDHRANAIVSALRNGQGLSDPGRKRTFAVVWRKDFVVWRRDLSRAQFEILSALQQGASLSQALARAGRRVARSTLEAEVRRSFSVWTSEGFFRSITGPDAR
jgi:hypothetical protein